MVLAISAFSLAACASPDSPCEDNPDGCGSTSPDAAGPHCGNGVCETGESSTSCAADCKPGPTCGDGTCDSTETASSCPSDCQTTIDVVNSSGVTVYYLYAWSCSVTSMGNSVLTSALYTGYNTTLTGPPGCWNFEAEGSGGTYISASYNNNLAGGQAYTWTIN
ncbi:MAG: hypothetical protein ABI467_06800 [Kofleriaceae bacterium]